MAYGVKASSCDPLNYDCIKKIVVESRKMAV